MPNSRAGVEKKKRIPLEQLEQLKLPPLPSLITTSGIAVGVALVASILVGNTHTWAAKGRFFEKRNVISQDKQRSTDHFAYIKIDIGGQNRGISAT